MRDSFLQGQDGHKPYAHGRRPGLVELGWVQRTDIEYLIKYLLIQHGSRV